MLGDSSSGFALSAGAGVHVGRQTTYREVCIVCGSDDLVPPNSPTGRQIGADT